LCRLSAGYLRAHPDTNFCNFPELRHVAIAGVEKDDVAVLFQPAIANAVTHLRLGDWEVWPFELEEVPRLPTLPNLVGLTTLDYPFSPAFPLPLSLRDLYLGDPVPYADADLLTCLTNLTSLHVNIYGGGTKKVYEALTVLTALQRLSIKAGAEVIPLVVNLSLLSHLRFNLTMPFNAGSPLELAPLARLQKLVHLEFGQLVTEVTPPLFEALGAITSLRSLYLEVRRAPHLMDLESYFPTPLTRLVLHCFEQDLSLLRGVKIEGLRELCLGRMHELGRDVVEALQRATGLTHLRLSFTKRGHAVWPGQVGLALMQMSQLRALSLESSVLPARTCVKAIGLLTELTSLKWVGKYVTNADVRAWLGLRKLRVLSILSQNPAPYDCITADTFFALARLPELRELNMREKFGSCPFGLTDEVRTQVNGERHSKGWAALHLTLMDLLYNSFSRRVTYGPTVMSWGLDSKFPADMCWGI
jgi:hypothetical protein